jgi:hypothetical protein
VTEQTEHVGTVGATATTVGKPAYSRSRVTGTTDAVPGRRGPRRARLSLRRVDPWSVFKLTLVYSLALLIMLVVAVMLLYGVLHSMGVFDSVDSFLRDLFSSSGSTPTVEQYVSFRTVVGWTAVVGAVNVVLVTALSVLATFLYNVCADLVGGIEVTLSEPE